MPFDAHMTARCDECGGYLAQLERFVEGQPRLVPYWGTHPWVERAHAFRGPEQESEASMRATSAGWYVTSTQCLCGECRP